MACIRKRRGKWVVDYRDGLGIRRWVTCRTRREAEDVLDERRKESRQPTRPAVDPNIAIAAYAARWLQLVSASIKPRTLKGYEQILRLHLLPTFGALKVRQLAKGRIKDFLSAKLTAGLSRNMVRLIHATLRAMLNAAVDDGVILVNPADKLGRQLRLIKPVKARQEAIKAMTREQGEGFLTTTRTAEVPADRRYYPLFLLLARTGLRLGEALALQWEDLDLRTRELRVVRAFSGGRLETPKSGYGRTVDVSQELARGLRRLQVDRAAEKLRSGWAEMPPWVFCTKSGTPLDESKVRKVFTRMLKRAGLPLHFSPHGLRHTFASLLLQQGVSPV